MALVKNYALGQEGVNVDASPAHVKATELLQAQNAIRDPLGVQGGLKNRPGFTKFNAVAAAGSLLGGVSGAAINLVDVRTLYVAEKDGSGNKYWYSTADKFATSARISTIADWQDPTTYYSVGDQVCHMGVFFNGQLFYAAGGYAVGSASPTIRAFNGVDDREITKVLPATTKGITGMFVQKGYLYVLTLDSGTTDADFVGRVFRVSETGQFLQMGTALATGYVPTSIVDVNGLLYVGASRLTTTNEARIYRINPLDETTWTLDTTLDADDYIVTGMASFQGLVYLTTKNGGAATKGKVKKRTIAGVYSTVDSTVNNTGTYESLAVFNGALYASSRNYSTLTNTAVIRKTTDGTTWSTVYNATATTGVGNLFVVGTYLFSIGGTGILYSTDGSSWTAATPAGTGNCDGVIGTLVRSGAAAFSTPTNTPTTSTNSNSPVTVSVGLSSLNDFSTRKRGWWQLVSGTTVEQNNMIGAPAATGSTTNGDVMADSRYIQFNDAGGANAHGGLIASTRPTRLGFYPRVQWRMRTYGTNQSEYIIWALLGNAVAFFNGDTMPSAGIGFRYHHPAGVSADSGNWFLCIHDGSSQVEVDTGVAVVGGTTAGSNAYRLTLDMSASTSVLTWTVENLTLGTSATGTTTVSASFDITTALGPSFFSTDVSAAVKVIMLSYMTLETY